MRRLRHLQQSSLRITAPVFLVLWCLHSLHSWTSAAQVPTAPVRMDRFPTRPRYHLAGRQPRYYQQEAVDLFFESAKSIRREKDRPMRLQLVGGSGKTAIYIMIAQQTLRKNPAARIVIFVPWRALAEQTYHALSECNLKTCVLGDGCASIDRSASVVVCVYNSAHRLSGQRFAVKLIDEAHHVESRGWFTHIMRHHVQGDLEADFSATFRASEVDYLYSFEKAVADGYLCDLQCFMVPVVVQSQIEEFEKLGDIIQQKEAELFPALILFNRIEHATRFSEHLNSRGIPTDVVSHKDVKKTRAEHRRALENGEVKALCTVRVFNEGIDIPSLRSVIIVSPRPSSDIGILQAAMRALRPHPSKSDNKASIVLFVNAGNTSTDYWVGKVVRHSLEQIAALWRCIGTSMSTNSSDLVENSLARLHLMDRKGNTLPATDDALWDILGQQGRPRQSTFSLRKWVWELVAWFRYFGDRPREATTYVRACQGDLKAQEFQQASRWKRARHLLQAGRFSMAEVELLQATGVLDRLEEEIEATEAARIT